MTTPSDKPAIEVAYQQSGHAVMSYIIRCGLTLNNEWLPLDSSLVLPAFSELSIEKASTEWNKITFSLGSLVTVPQVLLAGVLAQQIFTNSLTEMPPADDQLVKEAQDLLHGYLDEYSSDDVSYEQMELKSVEWSGRIFENVKAHMHVFWPAVSALATSLAEHKTLTENEAFKVIEGTLTPEQLARAENMKRRNRENFQ